jgi:Fungal specific transcription factor domain
MTITTIVSDIEYAPGYRITRSPSIFQASEFFYLQYHAELGSQLLSNLETQRNPLNEVLIPRAFSSPLLMNALCTLSAGHMSNRASSNQETLRKAEMIYYGKTLSGVRRALANLPEENVTNPAYRFSLEELLATVASLTKYEVVRGSVRSWRGHMEALQRLVTSCGGLMNLDPDIGDWLSGL